MNIEVDTSPKPEIAENIEKDDNTFKKTIALCKENLSLLVIIPTLIGGIFQLVKLASIHTSYIRFFSVSQVVADGLTVLFCLGTVGLTIFIYKVIITDFMPKPNDNYSWLTLLSFFIIFFYLYICYRAIIDEDALNFSSIVWASGSKIGGSIMLFLISSFFIKKHFSKFKKDLIDILLKFLILSIFYFFIKFFLAITSIYSDFNNLENKILLTKKVKSGLNLNKDPEFIYFNKDYVFYKYSQNGEEKFLVVDGKELIFTTTSKE